MAYEYAADAALDYFPCRYGHSRLLFRGPRKRLEGAYVAAVGGTETYGKFVAEPFPALLERALGMPVVNFGYSNAGPDVFAGDLDVIGACRAAKVTVLQLMGAPNLTNRFYSVHPRRNDRFLRASALMKTIFPEVDFTEFHFTQHMLSTLQARSAEKFALIEEELKSVWVARMRGLLKKFGGKTLLLWITDTPGGDHDGLGRDPLLVERAMVDALTPFASGVIRVSPSAGALSEGTKGMHFAPLDEPAAAALSGPRVHAEIAAVVLPAVRRLL